MCQIKKQWNATLASMEIVGSGGLKEEREREEGREWKKERCTKEGGLIVWSQILGALALASRCGPHFESTNFGVDDGNVNWWLNCHWYPYNPFHSIDSMFLSIDSFIQLWCHLHIVWQTFAWRTSFFDLIYWVNQHKNKTSVTFTVCCISRRMLSSLLSCWLMVQYLRKKTDWSA